MSPGQYYLGVTRSFSIPSDRVHRESGNQEMSSTVAETPQIVWGATLMQYVSGMGMMLVLYDWLLTLNEEVCVCTSSGIYHLILLTPCSQMTLVWPGAVTFPKALYYINRYGTIAIMIYSNYSQ